MGFKFAFLGELLSSLEDHRLPNTNSSGKKDESDFQIIAKWFSQHARHINHPDTDRLALLSCMFPERRPDRVYWLQATSLARVIGRCLGLGSSRLSELDQWRKPGGPDLGQCVQNVMCQAENHVYLENEVSVEEIDEALGLIASRCRFSGPQVRRQHAAVDVDMVLSPIYRRLSSRDAKWLTRMILKNYGPVSFPERYTLENFHFLLPHLLHFQNTFESALQMLQSKPLCHFPPRPDPKTTTALCTIALDHLRPRAGIKIGRPEYYKARSIKHCVEMARGRRMSIERKYDGEYCQIHIDLDSKQIPIQIFSKSGKDSTADRSGIISSLEKSLGIGTAQCKFTRRCILEGELVVWSDKRHDIADFHKLRKFMSRSGTFIGIESDSPPQPYEHLMIVLFDVLLLDDDVCLRKPHRDRRLLLKNMIHPTAGRAMISEQVILDFGQARSSIYNRLETTFSNAIARRWEGLVLKACDEPYFPIYSAGVDNSFGRWIKLKKDYIPGLGDTVDLALIGGYYDAHDAAAHSSTTKLKWTHFLVGCLMNKEGVMKSGQVPRFQVIDVVNHHCMHRSIMQHLNHSGDFLARDPCDLDEYNVEYGNQAIPQASKLFKDPFVVEMMGSGFEKPSGVRYFALRFPRILKIHADRNFKDAASFRELQNLAEEARSILTEDLPEEREHWRKRLKVGSGLDQYMVQRSESPSSRSSSAEPDHHSSTASTTSVEEHTHKHISSPVISKPTQSQSHSSINAPPAVYIDETIIHSDPAQSQPEANVLTENENLSQRQNYSQAAYTTESLDELVPKLKAKQNVPTKRSQPVNTLVSLHQTRATKDEHHDATPYEQPPQSPLTTIPVYMSGTCSGNRAVSEPDNTGLQQFLKSLGSQESRKSLRKSNPHAASQGTSIGIVLVNPAEATLGREIQRTAKCLSQTFKDKISSPLKGRIFFLDSLLLEQSLHPGDLKFCLSGTWSDLSKQYYYACLHWHQKQPDKKDHSRTSDQQKETVSPVLAVSFERDNLLALGEYISTNPPIHSRGAGKHNIVHKI
ncbi:Nucleic acid-binding OB-fold [Penicillium angulare]|uniref:Nucleic acid-binding OB-fold n=1 Tax=Penicillium angulare TaxID=116970 RepID=UPI002540CC0D|nr:Nucleic acid-binding OB-fold [Penicillium angulare]KAJ5272397.1 Nucleic acid-binding OB-fold [Penicillium angulare]